MTTFRFLSRLRKSVVSWLYISPLISCPDSPWSDNAYKSVKRDLFPESEGIVEPIFCQTSDAIPVMYVPKESLVFSNNL